MIAKSMVIKDRGGKSGGRAAKAVGLTSGGLCYVSDSRLRSSQGDLTAAQKSAEGIVGGTSFAEGLNVGKDATTRRPRTGHAAENQVPGLWSDGKG